VTASRLHRVSKLPAATGNPTRRRCCASAGGVTHHPGAGVCRGAVQERGARRHRPPPPGSLPPGPPTLRHPPGARCGWMALLVSTDSRGRTFAPCQGIPRGERTLSRAGLVALHCVARLRRSCRGPGGSPRTPVRPPADAAHFSFSRPRGPHAGAAVAHAIRRAPSRSRHGTTTPTSTTSIGYDGYGNVTSQTTKAQLPASPWIPPTPCRPISPAAATPWRCSGPDRLRPGCQWHLHARAHLPSWTRI